MISRLLAVQKINFNINPLVVVLLLMLVGCSTSGGGSSGGGITIVQNDSTPPTLTLGAGQPGGQGVTVSAGGSGQKMKLTGKTGALNLLVTATDNESGVQAVEIRMYTRISVYDADTSSMSTPVESADHPAFESTSPQKKPGETTVASTIMAEALDLSKEIPQGSAWPGKTITVDLFIYAVAVNHLGGRAQTPEITVEATWNEP